MPTSPRVFISYSHDSENHKQNVLQLSNRLRNDGVDCRIDQYETFPEAGWPQWTSRQIEESGFVLVVCTETYAKRASGNEERGLGLGACWEGQLITQEIYENGGRNSKFVPISFRMCDRMFFPRFLAASTYFHLDQEPAYESLLRLLTAQPAVVMPALGPLRTLRPLAGEHTEVPVSGDERTFDETKSHSVIWRLPRGFVIVEDLFPKDHDAWATTSTYYDYDGSERGATHYHESYRWRETLEGFDNQCRKLGIPAGDWQYARSALHFMIDVRHGRWKISDDGKIPGWKPHPSLYVTVHSPGNVRYPRRPPEYLPLAASGAIRDLAAEAQGIIDEVNRSGANGQLWSSDLRRRVARVRREVRIESGRRLLPDHPASKNLDEIVGRYAPDDELALLPWLQEFKDTICEAAHSIEDQVSI